MTTVVPPKTGPWLGEIPLIVGGAATACCCGRKSPDRVIKASTTANFDFTRKSLNPRADPINDHRYD
jgi:hypothetical protein